jgi:pimeloyl-ACP methyl ester carboxylesterase
MLTAGCAQYSPPVAVHDYVVSLDSDAMPHDPVAPFKQLSVKENGEFDCYIDHILSAMDQWHASRPDQTQTRKVLIFIHGGLTSLSDASQDALAESSGVKSGGSYPIYIDWDSDFLSSYGEHLFTVSQGEKQYQEPAKTARALLSPFYLIADLGRAISRIPVVWSEQIGSDSQTVQADLAAVRLNQPDLNWVQYAPFSNSLKQFKRLSDLYADDAKNNPTLDPYMPGRKQIMISIGSTSVTSGELAGLAAIYTATIPSKFGLSWILDGFGKSSWDNMIRRTLLLVDGSDRNPDFLRRAHPRSVEESRDDSEDLEPVGPVRLVVDKLFEHIAGLQAEAKNKNLPVPNYEITLVGHSMGSMVINELLTKEIERDDKGEFKNIVFLAGACSVRDCSRCVAPYLLLHPHTQFFNLCLHPVADLSERYEDQYELPPRGSLLVWIDEFLSDPPTMLDRTMGRWDNVLSGIGEFPQSIRGQMTIKAFDKLETDNLVYGDPQKHGFFREQPYWDENFWKAGPPLTQDQPLYQAVKQAVDAANAKH